MAPKCPKDATHVARRVYVQVASPKTGRSTTVTLPYVYCGNVGTQVVEGRVVGTFEVAKGQHGLVAIPSDLFAVERRQSIRLTTKRHAAWKGLPAKKATKAKASATPPKKASRKAASAPPAARKPRTAPKGGPKAPRAARAVSAPPAAAPSKTEEPPMAAAVAPATPAPQATLDGA